MKKDQSEGFCSYTLTPTRTNRQHAMNFSFVLTDLSPHKPAPPVLRTGARVPLSQAPHARAAHKKMSLTLKMWIHVEVHVRGEAV